MDDHSQIEEVIREIATKHGIVVSRDDPILVLQTINNRLLLDSAKAQKVMLAHHQEELEALALRWSNDATGKAERILVASLSASKEVLATTMDAVAAKTAAAIAVEIDSALTKLAKPVANVHRIATLMLIAACITMGAAATALWANMH